MIETITPILRVADMTASRRYYLDTLGFRLDWEGPQMASVSRDGYAIMLCEGQQGRTGAWVWVGVEDAAVLCAAFVAANAVIRDPPQNFAWAYEFQVEDLDGNVLRFGSEPRVGAASGLFKACTQHRF